MTELIGLSGYPRCGKDTVGRVLAAAGYTQTSVADLLQQALYALDPTVYVPGYGHVAVQHVVDHFGWEWTREKVPDVRRFLQRLGHDVTAPIFGEQLWMQAALAAMTGPSVFTSVRFPYEADLIRRADGELWRVERPGYGPADGHQSETAMDDYDYDRWISNDADLAGLEATVQRIFPLEA